MTIDVILAIIWMDVGALALQCYSCQGTNDTSQCQTTTTCNSSETCFTNKSSRASGNMVTMGCASLQVCSSSVHHGGGALVGRAVLGDCHECCSRNLCNKALCNHLDPSVCVDDEATDCARLQSLFDICNGDAEKAASICPKFCNLCTYTNGQWSEWSSWSSCSITCGEMTLTRSRSCTNPAPSPRGKPCVGSPADHKQCVLEKCPVFGNVILFALVHGGWSGWVGWGTCSATCGVGIQHRERSCTNPAPSRFGDHCFGDSTDDRVCVIRPCHNGHWSIWDDWSQCTVPCGGGYKQRHRSCNNPSPSQLGQVCIGNGAVRLSGSGSGRVEIYLNRTWGTICDDSFDNEDAQVICFMLGYSRSMFVYNVRSGAVAKGNAYFGQGLSSMPILLDDLGCSGSENNVLSCSHRLKGHADCGHGEDAGVICPTNGAVTLSGSSSNKYQGRVEIYMNDTWGTVCDNSFDNEDALVVCRMLGISSPGAVAKRSAHFGQGSSSMPILLDEIGCSGSESSVLSCSHRPLGQNTCGHGEDAGVICTTVMLSGTNSSSLQGRVEIYLNNKWGTICDDSFDNEDAQVVCRMLGLPSSGAVAKGNAYFGQGLSSMPILLDDLGCSGSESSVLSCSHRPIGHADCGHGEDAGVICPTMRLSGTNSSSVQGRVEIFLNNEWGTICDDSFDNEDAQVICRMLGLPSSGAVAIGNAYFGQGLSNMPILLDDLGCSGSESSVLSCSHRPIGHADCGHGEDAGVICPH
ncbi:DMBT1-like protein, partial [Mya arenaria]